MIGPVVATMVEELHHKATMLLGLKPCASKPFFLPFSFHLL